MIYLQCENETLIESNNYPEAKELLTKALNFELHKQEISQKKLGKENRVLDIYFCPFLKLVLRIRDSKKLAPH